VEAHGNNIALELSRNAVVLPILVPNALAVCTPHRRGYGYRLFTADVLNARIGLLVCVRAML
jgi:hypothetical protein